jgi:hypothetical protein
MKIHPSSVFDILANTQYEITMTTLNGLQEVNGFRYPTNPGIYYANVEVYKAGVLVE